MIQPHSVINSTIVSGTQALTKLESYEILLPFACGEDEYDGEVATQAKAGGQGEEDDERDLERMADGLQARVVEVLLGETGVSPRHVGKLLVIVQVRHPTLE